MISRNYFDLVELLCKTIFVPLYVVAANGKRGIKLAERFGQGWITTGPQADELEEWWSGVAELARRYGGEGEAEGRLETLRRRGRRRSTESEGYA